MATPSRHLARRLAGASEGPEVRCPRNSGAVAAQARHARSALGVRWPGRPAPLSGDAVCEIVQNLAARAGLVAGDFGAHSLRSGFITEALTDDKVSIAEVQDVTHHVDINVLATYRRLVNLRRNNAVKRM